MNKKTTIKELAKEAGVSIATVSMILNGKDQRISKSTRERVLKLAKERNYIKNTVARGLVTKKTSTLGFLMPDITNPFFPEIARGAEDRCALSRYNIIYCSTDDDPEVEQQKIELLMEKMVDGIIFTHVAGRYRSENLFDKVHVPVVLIDRNFENPFVKGRVLIDNFQAAYDATCYLIQNGHRRIAYLSGSKHTATGRDRFMGYKKALEDYNIKVLDEDIKEGRYRWKSGYTMTKELDLDKVDAIFAGNDLIAFGCYRALYEKGYKIPEDMSVVGFDNVAMSSLIEPPLTTVDQPTYQMGYQAADLLIRYIEGDACETSTIFLKANFIERQSVRSIR